MCQKKGCSLGSKNLLSGVQGDGLLKADEGLEVEMDHFDVCSPDSVNGTLADGGLLGKRSWTMQDSTCRARWSPSTTI